MNIGKFSVKNSVLVNLTMAILIVLGIASYIKLPQELQGNVSFGWVIVAISYPGASAEEIEKSITIKVEKEISDIDKINKITSTSREGVMVMLIHFNDDISDSEFKRLYQDVRVEIDKVSLPQGALTPYIDDFSSDDFNPMVSLTLDYNEDLDPLLVQKTSQEIQDHILSIKNISSSDIIGNQERKIIIEANQAKMEAFGISLNEIINGITLANSTIPGGELQTESRNYLIQTGKSKTINDIGDIIVRAIPGKGSILLSDIATINNGLAKSDHDMRYNGKKAISYIVTKTQKGNSIELVDTLKSLIDELKTTLPEGMDIRITLDTSDFIKQSIDILKSNAILGFVTLILILVLFIGFRNSLITAMGIPVTLAITFIFMTFYGESVNANSLFALVMVLGMVVDHAIVIIENGYRHYQMGETLENAAIKGTNEVVKPVIAGTLTTICVFLPLMLVPGIMGKFMRVIPIVVCLALVASTFEALFILPSHFAEWGSRRKKRDQKKGPQLDPITRLAHKIFKPIISTLYHHRYITIFASLIMTVGVIFLAKFVKIDPFAGEFIPQMYIDIQMPVGTPREKTNLIAKQVENELLPQVNKGDIKSVTTNVGFMISESQSMLTQDNLCQITVEFKKKDQRKEKSIPSLLEQIKGLTQNISGAESIKYRVRKDGPPQDKPLVCKIQGKDLDKMFNLAEEYKNILSKDPILYNVGHDFTEGKPELKIIIDEKKAVIFGLSKAEIGLFIRNAFDGNVATKIFDNDDEIEVLVRLDQQHRNEVADIQNLKIPSRDGRMIPFSSIGRIEREKSISAIIRQNEVRTITLSADIVHGNDPKTVVDNTKENISKLFKEQYQSSYPNITLNFDGQFEEFNQIFKDILKLIGIGILGMLLVMGAQFKSYLQPILISTTILFAAVGCILYLVITGTPLSLMVALVMGALIGICVNDAIVLISFINGQRSTGTEVGTSVINGTITRLRPIVLTSMSTIAGLIPMALELGGDSSTWAPMASIIIFGLLISTIGTLIVIPCLYGILNDFTEKLGFKMKLEGDSH